jgi:hypothetical protein
VRSLTGPTRLARPLLFSPQVPELLRLLASEFSYYWSDANQHTREQQIGMVSAGVTRLRHKLQQEQLLLPLATHPSAVAQTLYGLLQVI